MGIEKIIAITLFCIVLTYFTVWLTWKLGKGLAKNSFEHKITAWLFSLVLFLVGVFGTFQGVLIALVLCLPIIFFMLVKILGNISYTASSSERNFKHHFITNLMRGSGAIISYILTHHFFGFGIPEASFAMFFAAFALGKLDYTA